MIPLAKMKRKITKKINDLHNEEETEAAMKLIQLRSLKNDIIISCSSSVKSNLGHNDADQSVKEAVSPKKKAKKFRSIIDLYNITKPM